jgi:hypothetical protein
VRPDLRKLMSSLVAGLLVFAAPVIWILFQQGVGAASYLHCEVAKPPWGGMLGCVATLACAGGAARCWLSRRHGTDTRRFLMMVGAGSGLIFALAALVMTVAILVVPACTR